ncbi:MAG: hypothetical protein Aurels2KO_48250 [Aureliella sp.]
MITINTEKSKEPIPIPLGSWRDLEPRQVAQLGLMANYAAAGVCTIPIACDGTKKPCLPWRAYQRRLPNPVEIWVWHHQWRQRREVGFAVVCGSVSGGLEVLDFDDGDLWAPWWYKAGHIVERYDLPRIFTPSRGWHVYLRCQTIAGNQKLAKSESGDTLIETRGEGGYLLAPGNPRSAHPTGRLYLQAGGVELPQVPVISADDRQELLKAAASFDRSGIRGALVRKRAQQLRYERYAASRPSGQAAAGLTPWGDFKARATWGEVLEPHGWTKADSTFWTRPGGDFGAHSASCSRSKDGTSVLVVFSSNAGPLSPVSGDHATFDLFSAYAALNHEGDRKAAARELRRSGYGGQA